jgi:hypothetical protein
MCTYLLRRLFGADKPLNLYFNHDVDWIIQSEHPPFWSSDELRAYSNGVDSQLTS